MKNHSENTPEKMGGGTSPSAQAQAGIDGGVGPGGATANAPGRVPTLGRYVLVLVVVCPLALLYLLLGLVAQVLRVPSTIVYLVAYVLGSLVRLLTGTIMGRSNLPPPH